MPSFYNVGLGNVGSYQVSGRPWVKNISLTGVQSSFIEFPKVTNSLQISNDLGSTGNNLDVVFCEPTRGIDMPGTSGPERLEASIPSSDELTISIWVKYDTLINARILEFDDGAGNDYIIQSSTLTDLRLVINGGFVADSPAVLVNQEWFHLVAVMSNNDNRVYFNGERVITDTSEPSNPMNILYLGGQTANHNDYYSNACLFNTALTDSEVRELYDGQARLKPTKHSNSSLISWWAFEDNQYKNFYATADTVTTIYDRISNNNLVLSSGVLTFIDGFTLDNAFARHKITLSGQEQFETSCKARQVFIRSDNNLELSIFASLTNIPSSRMHDLTGPGIDE